MKPIRAWQGVRLRRVAIGSDPDAAPRTVTLPASWDDEAAAALASLAPGDGAAHLAQAAEGWIRPVAERARQSGLGPMADAMHGLLRRQQAAPSLGIWRGQPEDQPGYVLNLAAFHDATAGFDILCFETAVGVAVTALTLLAPAATRIELRLTDFAGLLACLGLDYDSVIARDLLACLAALLRASADAASASLAGLFGISPGDAAKAPPPPSICVIPGLADAASGAWAARPRTGLRHAATTAIAEPDAVDALLGVETGGIAPAFSPLCGRGGLTRTARAMLAARGLTAETALADLLAGIDHLPPPAPAAYPAMHAAAAPYLHRMPRLPAIVAAAPAGRRDLPDRRRGYTQRASVGGHTLFLRTGDYDGGKLGEIGITPAKDGAAFRGLMDCFGQAVSIGLQHGVPLGDYVDAFVQTRFGASGAVEGDPAVAAASSPLDYVFRHLAVNYLHRRDLPPVLDQDAAPPPDGAPLLPLDLPTTRRRTLRLVGS